MSWIITHTITAPFENETIYNTGLIVTHNINPVTEASATQIQSDWNQSNSSAVDFIKNKPSIPAAQVNSDWNSSSGVSQILNKPTIPAAQVNSDWNSNSGLSQILNKPSLATVATSGSYNDLSNKLSNGDFEVFGVALSDVSTNLSVGTSKKTFHWPFNFILSEIIIEVSTAPTGSNIIVDVNNNSGSSIFSTRISIDISEYTSLTATTPYVLSSNPTTFTKGDVCTIDLDQIGATVAGKELTIWFKGIKS